MFFFLNKCHTTIIDKIKTININLFLFKLCLFYVAFNIYFTLVNKTKYSSKFRQAAKTKNLGDFGDIW